METTRRSSTTFDQTIGHSEESTTSSHNKVPRRWSVSPALFLVAVLVILATHCRSAAAEEFGSLRLCPAGGRSFMMAWNLACEMKRKKRSVPDIGGLVMGTEMTTTMSTTTGSISPHVMPSQVGEGQGRDDDRKETRMKKRAAPEGYRPATLTEIMRICCDVGCEVRDLLAYCDPFGPWNS